MSKYVISINANASVTVDGEDAVLFGQFTPEQRAESAERVKAEVERFFTDELETPEGLDVKVEITEVADE